jgi:hypothetical protein
MDSDWFGIAGQMLVVLTSAGIVFESGALCFAGALVVFAACVGEELRLRRDQSDA